MTAVAMGTGLTSGFRVLLRDGFVVFEDSGGLALASFPAWEHAARDLVHFIRDDIPSGPPEDPFVDTDEEWQITIVDDGTTVHVTEVTAGKESSFSVSSAEYFAAWMILLDQYNPALPLDL